MKGSIIQEKDTKRWKGVVDLPWKKPDGSRNQKTVRGKVCLAALHRKKIQ